MVAPGPGTDLLASEVLRALGQRHGKTPAQIVLRWHVQQGIVTFPKSAHPQRLRENLDVFDFELTEEDFRALASLETGQRVSDQDPATYEEF